MAPALDLGFAPETPPETRRRVVAVLSAAIVAIGVSAVLVKGMEARPLAIAAWRTLGAALLLSPALAAAPRPNAREALSLAASGLVLAAHFGLWFASLTMTSVLRSTVLVCLTPIWTGVLEIFVDGRVPPGRFWLGVSVALGGVALMTGGVWEGGGWQGDALAVVAGMLFPVYLLLGRGYRRRAGTAPAMAAVCAAAALALWPAAWLTGTPLAGWSAGTWMLLVAAVALPQLIGHQGMSYATAWLPASTVGAATLLEPLVAAALSALVLGELPSPLQAAGAAVVLVGLGIGLR